MNYNPLVSIIVPVYNSESYINKCVGSLINQSYQNIEIILVNDGSSDRSGLLCDEIAKIDSRIHVFHKQNGGVSSARNMGMRMSKGNYMMFVDSDDWVDSEYVSSMKQAFGHHSSCLAIQGMVYEANGIQEDIRSFADAEYDNTDIILCITLLGLLSYGGPCCKLFSRDIIEKNKIIFPENYSYGEDTVFFLKYLQHVDKIITVNKSTYHYRKENNCSLSTKPYDFNKIYEFIYDSIMACQQIDKKYHTSSITDIYLLKLIPLFVRIQKDSILLKYDRYKRARCSEMFKVSYKPYYKKAKLSTIEKLQLIFLSFPFSIKDIVLKFILISNGRLK